MAMQSPFFNKRENDVLNSRSPGANPQTLAGAGGMPQANPAPVAAAANVPAANSASANPPPTPEGESKLTVGPNIKLKGVEITDCDTLVVEGSVEATMDSRVIQISERGAFKGSAEVDIAEIRGHFEGRLIARQKLVIFPNGRVTGQVSYEKLVIEEGGQLSGDIEVGSARAARAPVSSIAPVVPVVPVNAGMGVRAVASSVG